VRSTLPRWLVLASATAVLWGVWGALAELPERAGFPATLGYIVWAVVMALSAGAALHRAGWPLGADRRALALCASAGTVGAAGQLSLFQALRTGPAYLVFPLASLYPVVAIALSAGFLHERATRRQSAGIAFAIPAAVLLSYSPPAGDSAGFAGGWLLFTMLVCLGWGGQAFLMRDVGDRLSTEAIFGGMAFGGVSMIPVALAMTDLAQPIHWGATGPYLAAAIHVLNAAGGFTYAAALGAGPALLVAPVTAMSPLVTIIVSLGIFGRWPSPVHLVGMAMAIAAIYLLADR
jgi:drug/metabolite transporter (DMT)-like permease